MMIIEALIEEECNAKAFILKYFPFVMLV